MEVLHKEQAYAIMGACFEVYKDKGCASWRPCTRSALPWSLPYATSRARPNPRSR